MEKTDLSTARRNMHSSNIKTRKRALRTLHEVKRNAKKQK
ncbi:putative metal homeostasis protein [Lacticaseibacillus pantheris]|nr:putative metal homeostasis protein [Lacticaseibacillus pantheris]WKF84096.1 putative metal homeostasis protein [Lacticaseibacillus pantheris]